MLLVNTPERYYILRMIVRILMFSLIASIACRQAAAEPSPKPVLSVHFSPSGGCTRAVAELIGEARHTVHVAAYSFTSQPIADALVAARARGVDVEAVLDKSDSGTHAVRSAKAPALIAGDVQVWIDRRHPIFHDKYVIVDGSVVETGSFNYTAQAERGNAENCLVVRDRELAAAYLADWRTHQQHASRPEVQ
jgi:phosphatidylserine/phosphatidylglycerophosphate/cardiolipin synthase-like enzyme